MFKIKIEPDLSLDRVKMGLPPTLEEAGIPMRSAMSLLSEKYNPALKGIDTTETKAGMLQEVASKIPQDRSARAAQYLQDRKSKIVHGSISRRNPDVLVRGGGAGAEDTTPSVLKQLGRQKKIKGGAYES